jgi:L-aminopeptidase/D-esterase-like protein
MTHYTADDYAAAGITLAEDFREAIGARRRRRIRQIAAIVLSLALAFGAGVATGVNAGPSCQIAEG